MKNNQHYPSATKHFRNFELMKKRLFVSFPLLFSFLCGVSQQIHVKGVVRSAKDSSLLAGVSVMVNGTNKGTTTNAIGSFSIEVEKNGMLSFSSVGYVPQEIPVESRPILTVFLATDDKSQLGEVVVTTALGIKKQQKALGYAVQEVNGE